MSRKIKDNCLMDTGVKNGRRYFRCKNLKRPPSAQEIVDSVKVNKIKYKLK
jgi:hypothetical protein